MYALYTMKTICIRELKSLSQLFTFHFVSISDLPLCLFRHVHISSIYLINPSCSHSLIFGPWVFFHRRIFSIWNFPRIILVDQWLWSVFNSAPTCASLISGTFILGLKLELKLVPHWYPILFLDLKLLRTYSDRALVICPSDQF